MAFFCLVPTLVFFQLGSVEIFMATRYLSCSWRRTMKGVPGVMQLLSNLMVLNGLFMFLCFHNHCIEMYVNVCILN